ncbi:LPS-assembly protein [Sulfurivirga caldicuralii]|uniref:LPS-assembly protein LptD n=1 Tax=Sulfurivirga caldicuralii TaxID=364032 RepID=A0A1N6G5H6_9GAMM|nr:LPS-assembly protein [Sulfurivirga caldicuralii]
MAPILNRLALFFSLFLLSSAAAASCARPWLLPPRSLPSSGPTHVWGVNLNATRTQVTLTGDVELLRPRLYLQAGQLRWDRQNDVITARNSVRAQTDQVMLKTDLLTWWRQQQRVATNAVIFQLRDRNARGSAARFEHRHKAQTSNLKRAQLTTCPLGTDDWFFRFSDLKIDQKAQRAYGTHAWFDFYGVPLFYSPYISYPLNDRASGFLMPVFESYQSPNRTSSSWIVGIPYYFALAPNYDDTLTVLQMQDRGTLLDNEFRYLTPRQHGMLTLSGIQDEIASSQGITWTDAQGQHHTGKTLDTRWRLKWISQFRLTDHLRGQVDWHEISDPDFYADIPLESAYRTASTLPRTLQLDWRQDNVSAFIRHRDYVRLRNAGYNYETRPQLGITWQKALSRTWRTQLYAENSWFEIPVAGHTKPEGQRLRLKPTLWARWNRLWGDWGATLQMNAVSYELISHAPQKRLDSAVPTVSVDGRLIFERDIHLFGKPWTQTLEPKLQLTWTPYVDQETQPLFDTGTRSLSFDNLFALNRFSGGDRVGDTLRLSAALTTRLLDTRGKERLSAAIGQAFYLTPRYVTLGANRKDDSRYSHIFAQLRAHSGPLFSDNVAEINPADSSVRNLTNRLAWRQDRFTFLLNHQLANNLQSNEEQTLASGFFWQPHGRWQLGAYVNYDLKRDLRSETNYALGYDNCCWRTELRLEETKLADGRYNYGFQFVFVLKGISTLGTPMSQLLNEKIGAF